MTMRPGGWRRGFTLSLFVGALLSSGACGVREDEFDCENAVARLSQCCPGFDARSVDCTYDSTCGPTYPALDVDQSHCILQSSCDGLRSAGVCDRAAMLPGSSMPTTTPSICPPGAPIEDASTQPVPTMDASAVPQCTPCPSDPIQLCSTAADCPADHACVSPSWLAGISICVASDGGVEAPLDATRDTSSEATPDAVADVAPEASTEASVEAATPAGDAGLDAPDSSDGP